MQYRALKTRMVRGVRNKYMDGVLGIHHMTAISGPAQENLDFYAGILGLRLVKLTVNFDDPSAYHLYYGDGAGNPGTILTFFPYPNGHQGRSGSGQASVTRLSVPSGSLGYWLDRLTQFEIDFDHPQTKNGRESFSFRAPDGLEIELVVNPNYDIRAYWDQSPVPKNVAISGMDSIQIIERTLEPTKEILEDILGFQLVGQHEDIYRFEVNGGGCGKTIEVVIDPTGPSGKQGPGGVHHIAFRTEDENSQQDRRIQVLERGLRVSAVMDRDYFKSIYFREPGGVLFEIATDPPGFTVDETPETIGTSLRLPKQYEPMRTQIEHALPPLIMPSHRK